MPGGRMTLTERECIATGLAEGIGYAEIARQLDRPTSTVSREVARNGGPGRYRAERAHRATQLRSQRRNRSQISSTAPEFGDNSGPVADFTDELAEVFMQTGMPRMTSRIMACLYARDSGSCTAAELVRRLRVSPATISTAVRSLEEQDLIRRERDTGRRDRYVVDDHVWLRATIASIRANDSLVAAGRHGAEVLGAHTPAGARLDEMARFLDYVSRELADAVERWQEFSRQVDVGSPL
ncbi:DNA-binding transcriptional ArsR family regulator [Nocardia sp. GAS34]|uniref:GbsR/MarR family transcriptional regulator n=1 Tax=unclassified Nocardia TaxID=2637762 RepID=UPI003D1A77C3